MRYLGWPLQGLRLIGRHLYYPFIDFWMNLFIIFKPWLPRWFLHMWSMGIEMIYFVCKPEYRRNVYNNLSRVLGTNQPALLRRTVLRVFLNNATYFVDLFYFSSQNLKTIERHIEQTVGEEHLHVVLAQGRGAILVTAHMGNWELGGMVLAVKGFMLNIVYYPDAHSSVERFRSRARKAMHVHEIAMGNDPLAVLPAIRALRRNEIVALQGDRVYSPAAIEVEFFGAPARFPAGPALLARLSGAPLLPAFILKGVKGGFRLIIEAPIHARCTDDHQADLQETLTNLARRFEYWIRQAPDQWYCFQPVWGQNNSPSRSLSKKAT